MSIQLFNHINQFVEVSEDDFSEIISFFELEHHDKKAILREGGKKNDLLYFVINGCLHMYFINDKGIERTIQFAIENWWMADHLAFFNQNHSDFYIQAAEPSQVLSITYANYEKLLDHFPQLEKYFRSIYEISYGSSLMRIKYIFDLSKEDSYFHFIEHFPKFAQRVPQYLIASFLGLTPEYVSEIRKRHRS